MSVTLNVEIVGNKLCTDIYNTSDITLVGKSEIELHELIVGDSWQSIPVSKIGTISKIIANVETDSAVVDPVASLRISYTTSGSITIPFNGIFVYSVDETFAGTITSLDISTSSTTQMTCYVSVLGV